MIRILLFVATGGALGSVLRYLMQRILNPSAQDNFPTGTWLANTLGCLLIGVAWAISEKYYIFTEETKLFLFTGLLGGFTTLSAFSQESIILFKAEKFYLLALYLMATLVGGWLATWGGYKLFSN
ncbi:MAG: fluoride efflux transporter CrcB [Sphingomonadales bacterium]|nr:fluoride efflux transporter CrcB [Sphingomonadales bacterium]